MFRQAGLTHQHTNEDFLDAIAGSRVCRELRLRPSPVTCGARAARREVPLNSATAPGPVDSKSAVTFIHMLVAARPSGAPPPRCCCPLRLFVIFRVGGFGDVSHHNRAQHQVHGPLPVLGCVQAGNQVHWGQHQQLTQHAGKGT